MNEATTTNKEQVKVSNERRYETMSGWPFLGMHFLAIVATPFMFVATFSGGFKWPLLVVSILMVIGNFISFFGYFTLQPNESRVLILFGDYKGTERRAGFHWTNPFYSKKKVSLRAHNLNGPKLKVNDKRGNPIEIAAVVVWRVDDTAQAIFDVEDYEDYVEVQSESAVRHLARSYFYDHAEDHEVDEITLRSGGAEVIETLKAELQERLAKAGVTVEESRITHLAYAQEIASAMLRRQQAEAIISARKKIVQVSAVSMVDMAVKSLDEGSVINLDEERKAAMVSNLLVIFCGDKDASPVVNTGTLYT